MKRVTLLLLLLLSNLRGLDTIQTIILAAGKSSRFEGPVTKLATSVCGTPLILHPIRVAAELQLPLTLVLGHQKELIQEIVHTAGYHFDSVVQEKQLGTGHALQTSRQHWHKDHILVLNGDMPMIGIDDIKTICETHLKEQADATFGVSYNVDPDGAFGRVVTDDKGTFIVEKKDFIGSYKDYPMINSGIYIFKRSYLEKYIDKLVPNKKSGEYNITDLINMANELDAIIRTARGTYHFGANTKEDIEKVEQTYTLSN